MKEPDEICHELAKLRRTIGDELSPPRYSGEPPDRSNSMRPALVWCAAHKKAHRRSGWQKGLELGICKPGQDPRRAGVLASTAQIATPPKYSTRHRTPQSTEPIRVSLHDLAEVIDVATVSLAARIREMLGDITREHDAMAALARLPMLFGRLHADHVLVREAMGYRTADGRWRDGTLPKLARTARIELGIDRRPLPLWRCPSAQDEYIATYGGGMAPAAMWDDGRCRDYDPIASGRASRAARHVVDIWRDSILYCLDAGAPIGSEERAIRCPGCGRAWYTEMDFATLLALIDADRAGE